MPISIRAAAACVVVMTLGCHHRPAEDDCDRAYARLDRINASRAMPTLSGTHREEALEVCRHGKHAASDPVLRCAMDAETDAAAASCIDQFEHSVVKPGAGGGSGINPLLDQR